MAPHWWYLLLFAVVLQRRCDSVEQRRRFSFPTASASVSTMLDDEAEAALFQRAIGGSAELTKSSMRLLARGVRRAGDTFAGLVSGVIKASGGVFNLLADALSEVSTPLIRPRAPHDRMPHFLDHVGRKIGRGLRSGAKVLFFVGESCILAGETTEALTVGLGQSIEDSFLGLEFVAGVIQRGAQRVLQPPHRIKQPGGDYVWRRGGGFEEEGEEKEGEGEQRKNDSTAIGGRAGDPPLHAPLPDPALAATSTIAAASAAKPQRRDEAEEAASKGAATSPPPLVSYFVNLAIAGAARLDEEDSMSLGIPFLYQAFASWVLEPFSFQSVAGLSPPSISIHVMGSALFIAVMSSLSYSLTRRRVLVLFCSCLLAWEYLMAVDTVMRKKIETRTGIRAVGSFVKGLVEESERAKRAGGGAAAATNFFESSAWVNVLFSSLWTLDGYPYNNPRRGPWIKGGLGPYISETWELLLNDQLALVPPGVANLQLTRFSLGTLAPVVLAVRFDSLRDAICLAAPGGGGGGGGGGAGGRAAACHHLVAYVDFKYLSQDMDIVFSLRSPDVKSVLPEATVKLSEISLSGVVRIDAELSSDYPFVGNASISFMRLPVLDCSISSFGGVDLASIPGVHTWINITMTWLLSQYTAPHFGVFDLRHTICPACDGGKVAHAPWSAEAMKEAADALGNGLKGGWEQLRTAWRGIRARRERREVAESVDDSEVEEEEGEGGEEEEGEAVGGRTKSTAEIARDLVMRNDWSNGSMSVMFIAVLWLSFRLIRSNKPVQFVSPVSP